MNSFGTLGNRLCSLTECVRADPQIQAAQQMPPDMQQFVEQLGEWAATNESRARRDKLKFWSIKVPVILTVSCSGFIASLQLPSFTPILASLISGICIAIDGIVRPGQLYSIHKRAAHDIRELQVSMVNQWRIAKLQHCDSDERAARILSSAEKKRISIATYLKAGEIGVYLHPGQTPVLDEDQISIHK